MNKKTTVFETKRLLLKPTSVKDAQFIFELLNSPKWIKYIGDRNIKSVDDAKDFIKEKIIPHYQKLGYGNYTVIRKSDNSKIGTCGLYDREGFEGVDLGFAILPEFERNGFTFESTNKILDIAFEKFNLTNIKAITSKTNVASQKLLEKLGFELKETTKLDGGGEEMLLYVMGKTIK